MTKQELKICAKCRYSHLKSWSEGLHCEHPDARDIVTGESTPCRELRDADAYLGPSMIGSVVSSCGKQGVWFESK